MRRRGTWRSSDASGRTGSAAAGRRAAAARLNHHEKSELILRSFKTLNMHMCGWRAACGVVDADGLRQTPWTCGRRHQLPGVSRVALSDAGDHVARDGADVAGLAPFDGPPRHGGVRGASAAGGISPAHTLHGLLPSIVGTSRSPHVAQRMTPARPRSVAQPIGLGPELPRSLPRRGRAGASRSLPPPRARRRRGRRRHRQRARAVALSELRPGACEVVAREVGDVVERRSRAQPALRCRSAIIRQMRGRWDLGDREERDLARQRVGG